MKAYTSEQGGTFYFMGLDANNIPVFHNTVDDVLLRDITGLIRKPELDLPDISAQLYEGKLYSRRNLEDQLTAANKAIVALSEALDMHELSPLFLTRKQWMTVMRKKANEALTLHAPAIEKARGG